MTHRMKTQSYRMQDVRKVRCTALLPAIWTLIIASPFVHYIGEHNNEQERHEEQHSGDHSAQDHAKNKYSVLVGLSVPVRIGHFRTYPCRVKKSIDNTNEWNGKKQNAATVAIAKNSVHQQHRSKCEPAMRANKFEEHSHGLAV